MNLALYILQVKMVHIDLVYQDQLQKHCKLVELCAGEDF